MRLYFLLFPLVRAVFGSFGQRKLNGIAGWSILVASWLDTYSDILINNWTLSDLGGLPVVYRYGFIVFYGIGFGFPYLLNMQDPILQCSSKDFAGTPDSSSL